MCVCLAGYFYTVCDVTEPGSQDSWPSPPSTSPGQHQATTDNHTQVRHQEREEGVAQKGRAGDLDISKVTFQNPHPM